MENRKALIFKYVQSNPVISSKEIHQNLDINIGYATVKRILNQLKTGKLIISTGNKKSTRYLLSPASDLFYPVDMERYFRKNIDERAIKTGFNFDILCEVLDEVNIFSEEETEHLNTLQEGFRQNLKSLSESQFQNELDKFIIDLSWKSSLFNDDPYNIFEVEALLTDGQRAKNRSEDLALFHQNNRDLIYFLFGQSGFASNLTVSNIKTIHKILTKNTDIPTKVRNRRMTVSGTNFRFIADRDKITGSLYRLCDLINEQNNVFEKAFIVLILLEYLYPFDDSNNSIAVMTSNAILISHNYCPVSLRLKNNIDYKKALVLFLEQHNINYLKEIFIQRYEFSVNNYF